MTTKRRVLGVLIGLLFVFGAAAIGQFRFARILPDPEPERERHPGSEFQMARVRYRTVGGGGSHGLIQPWWAIDYPYAEEHFFAALRRSSNISVSDTEAFVELSDDRIFQYPFCNIDMGDSWEHADDAFYPMPMTALGYKFGINYVVYAITH